MVQDEPILIENKDRFVLFPIKHKEIWELYKKAEHNFWFIDGISLADDIADFNTKLTEQEKRFVRFAIIALQLRFNKHTNKILTRFLREVQYPEARCFYGFQGMTTDVHSETYSMLSGTFLGENAHQSTLFKEIRNSAGFQDKSNWIKKHFQEEPH